MKISLIASAGQTNVFIYINYLLSVENLLARLVSALHYNPSHLHKSTAVSESE